MTNATTCTEAEFYRDGTTGDLWVHDVGQLQTIIAYECSYNSECERQTTCFNSDTILYSRMATNRCLYTVFFVIVMCNIIHGLAPAYLTDIFILNNSMYDHHTRGCTNIHVRKYNLSVGQRTFAYRGGKLWDTIP